MRRRSFLTFCASSIYALTGCIERSEAQPLTEITTISSYPHEIDKRLLLPKDTYGGWGFRGEFTRTISYRIETHSSSPFDVFAISGAHLQAFEDSRNVDLLDGSATNATEASGGVESPSSRGTFYLILDNTDRGVAAAETDIEVEVSLRANII